MVVAALKEAAGADLDIGRVAEPLELLTRSLDRQAALHRVGRTEARRALVGMLVRRAQVIASASPSPVLGPIVIAGLPGSAASFLRSLVALHPEVAAVPDEDDRLGAGLANICFELRWHVPAYAEWFDGARLDDAYRLLRDSLATEASAAPPVRWLLGSAQHLDRRSELAAAFPDPVIVYVEGGEDAVTDTTVELALRLRRAASDQVDPEKVHRYVAWRIGRLRDRAASRPGSDGITVVATEELLGNPAGCVRRVAEAAGLGPDAGFIQRVDDFLGRSGLR